MIRNVVMVKFKDGVDLSGFAEVKQGFIDLNPPGCVSYTIGEDLGLKEGAWSLAIVADFDTEANYRAYDLDAEHNRLRGLLGQWAEQVARVQFQLD